jgi:8-amino-7-oxononanoate synthase
MILVGARSNMRMARDEGASDKGVAAMGTAAMGAGATVQSWAERWRGVTADLGRAQARVDAVVDEIDGRMIRIGGRWLADFASGNYIGFDVSSEIVEAVPDYLQRWGTHTGFSRQLGTPRLYEEIEARLTALLRAEDVLVLPGTTNVHASVIPRLVGGGMILLDRGAHASIEQGCAVAVSHGATVVKFDHDDIGQVAQLLSTHRRQTAMICLDGIHAMTGSAPDLGSLAMLARAHDTLLYIDDTHGFGIIGERAPDEQCRYGNRGNSIVRHFGESYDNIALTGAFTNAYSSLLSFVALPTRLKLMLMSSARSALHSSSSPVASLARVLEGLGVNDRRGDQLRLELYRTTRRVLGALRELGMPMPAASDAAYPIIDVPLRDVRLLNQVGRFLFEQGIYAILATPPVAPHDAAAIRIHLTSANTPQQVSHLIDSLRALSDRGWLAGEHDPAASAEAVERGLVELVAC